MKHQHFKILVQNKFEIFEHKMEQSRKFQLQESLSQAIIAKIQGNPIFIENAPELSVFNQNAIDLQSSGKTYQNVLEEKLFTDSYRIFEEYLNDIFSSILSKFSGFLKITDKGESNLIDGNTLIEYIFETPNTEVLKNKIIEKRVKTYLQSDNIMTILGRFNTTFAVNINYEDTDLLNCQRLALIRNVITHNNSIVNEIFIQGVAQFRISNNTYEAGQSVLPKLAVEIQAQRILLEKIAAEIKNHLEKDNTITGMQNHLTSKLSKM